MDMGKDGTLTQMIWVICCFSLLSIPGGGGGGGGGNKQVFTTNLAPQCRAFSRAFNRA